jgi:excisionase family DNA binding protein
MVQGETFRILDRKSEASVAAVRRSAERKAPSAPKDWMTSGEIARALNMTDAAIRRWAREGLVEAIKTPGGQYRFRREALTGLMQVRRLNGAATAPAERRRGRS